MTERSDAPVAAAPKRSFFVRRVDATNQFEIFFVSAIATILLVRGILAATGWPQGCRARGGSSRSPTRRRSRTGLWRRRGARRRSAWERRRPVRLIALSSAQAL